MCLLQDVIFSSALYVVPQDSASHQCILHVLLHLNFLRAHWSHPKSLGFPRFYFLDLFLFLGQKRFLIPKSLDIPNTKVFFRFHGTAVSSRFIILHTVLWSIQRIISHGQVTTINNFVLNHNYVTKLIRIIQATPNSQNK